MAPPSEGTRAAKHVGGRTVAVLVSVTVLVSGSSVLVIVSVTCVVDVSVRVVRSVATVVGVTVAQEPEVTVTVLALSVVVDALTPRQEQAAAKSDAFGQLLQKRSGVLLGLLVVGHLLGLTCLLSNASWVTVTTADCVTVTGEGVSSLVTVSVTVVTFDTITVIVVVFVVGPAVTVHLAAAVYVLGHQT